MRGGLSMTSVCRVAKRSEAAATSEQADHPGHDGSRGCDRSARRADPALAGLLRERLVTRLAVPILVASQSHLLRVGHHGRHQPTRCGTWGGGEPEGSSPSGVIPERFVSPASTMAALAMPSRSQPPALAPRHSLPALPPRPSHTLPRVRRPAPLYRDALHSDPLPVVTLVGTFRTRLMSPPIGRSRSISPRS